MDCITECTQTFSYNLMLIWQAFCGRLKWIIKVIPYLVETVRIVRNYTGILDYQCVILR